MKDEPKTSVLEKLLEPISRAFNPASARALADTEADPAVQERLVAAVISQPPLAAPPGPGQKPPDGLTAREVEALALLASGLSNTERAQRLYLSNATVKTRINRIFAKTGARDRAQAGVSVVLEKFWSDSPDLRQHVTDAPDLR